LVSARRRTEIDKEWIVIPNASAANSNHRMRSLSSNSEKKQKGLANLWGLRDPGHIFRAMRMKLTAP
jgi:hypothetical protein